MEVNTRYFFISFRSEYEHPLVIGNVKRKATTMGVEVKTVHDWQQFLDDQEAQGVLYSQGERYRKSGFFQMSEDLKQMEEQKIQIEDRL